MGGLSIVLMVFQFIIAVIAIPHPIQTSANHTKCAYSELATGYLSVGKTVSIPGDCMSITCNSDLTLSGLTCPTYDLFPGCILSGTNYYLSYPDCCPQLSCDYNIRLKEKREVKSSAGVIKLSMLLNMFIIIYAYL